MSRDLYQRAKAVFLAVCEAPESERESLLDSLCAGDAALLSSVRAMLRADAVGDDGFNIDAIRGRIGALALESGPEAPSSMPVRVGRYRVIRRLAAGGMGAVYEAEQDDPRRRVALKVIRPGPTTSHLEQRFRHEAQLLARLRHPGIAQVHDAGVAPIETATGTLPEQPFLVMELIEGEALDAHAVRLGLPARDRIRLFVDVLDAVDHAHQQGVVHRDLKPANILVDADGRPKVVDFGVARLVDPDATTTTMHTAEGQLIGTLAYMSPEQAAGTPGGIDRRSDIYALGAVLYELLSGRRPLELDGVGIAAAARMISEEEPTRLGTIDTRLRGDIETITAKALEKDPTRRYATAADMATDIRRYLENMPITARPPSAMYQLRKFARRNRALVGGVAAVMLVLAAATPYSLIQAGRAKAAQRQAEQREAEARLEAAKFADVNAFLQGIFDAVNPERSPETGEATVRQLLDLAAARIDGGGLDGQPGVEVATRTTIGNAYRALALLEPAESMLRAAVAAGRRAYPLGHVDLAQAMNKLARTLQDAGQYDEAEQLFTDALAMRRRLLPLDHPDVAVSLNNLAHMHTIRGRHEAALAMHDEALAMRRRVLGNDDPMVANSLNNIGVTMFRMGRIAEAADAFTESLEIDRAARGDHPNVAATMGNVAVLRRMLGDLRSAESMARESLAMRRRFFDDSHPSVGHALETLGDILILDGRQGEAEPLLRKALEIQRSAHGPASPPVAHVETKLARALSALGAHDEALELARSARATFLAPPTASARDGVRAGTALVSVLLTAGRIDEAGPLSQRVMEEAAELPGETDPRRAEAALARARCLAAAGDTDAALALAKESVAALQAAYGPSSPDTIEAALFARSLGGDNTAHAGR